MKPQIKPLADNRKARHDYDILENLDGGLVLSGQETKSIREGGAKLDGAYIKVLRGELWLVGAHIRPYSKATKIETYDPDASRKILVHRKELRHLAEKTHEKGLTLVPLSFYPSGRRIKLSFGVCRGRKTYDKRDKLKERDQMRQTARELRGDE